MHAPFRYACTILVTALITWSSCQHAPKPPAPRNETAQLLAEIAQQVPHGMAPDDMNIRMVAVVKKGR